jgi:hypothetical protein
MPKIKFLLGAVLAALCSAISATAARPAAVLPAIAQNPPIQPLKARGEDFVDAQGTVHRLWGINLVSLYPEHSIAEKTAANLASLGVNCVRPHHILRSSLDWNSHMVSGALVDYKKDSTTFDPYALDRYDYLNASLKRHGIYLMLSIGSSRGYRTGDVEILDSDAADAKAWQAALDELQSWHWKKAFDVNKMLPLVDERAALVNEKFTRMLLKHVNPYTKQSYGTDPQVLTVEILNEFSLDYVIICKNKFPDYWQRKLDQSWRAYAESKGVPYCDIYEPQSSAQKLCRADFFRSVQDAYFHRIEKVIRECGFTGAVAFSNLWRGEAAAKMNADLGGYVEDHLYGDPRIAKEKKDFLVDKSMSRLADKPYILGEANYCEWGKTLKQQRRERATLPLALASYGAFNNWSGVIWFAWNHGGRAIAEDGWSKREERKAHLGDMISDGMMLDHFRTASAIFRRGLAAKSVAPKKFYVHGEYRAADYHSLVRGKRDYKSGWQNIHALKKVFAAPPAGDNTEKLLRTSTPSVLVSDTGELTKDTGKKHFTMQSAYAEAFSGNLVAPDKARLKHLSFSQSDCFLTLVAVANDDRNTIAQAKKLLLSRTTVAADGTELDSGMVRG